MDRRAIIRRLEKVKEESISLDELEETGRFLQTLGKAPLRPLMRRLWLEKRGDCISRYLYLLDFFDSDGWIDQLIRMALKRRDLDHTAKAAIRTALEACGVDVGHPPLSTLLADRGGESQLSAAEVLDRGEEGLLCFMEEFLISSQEVRLDMIDQLVHQGDPRVVDLLEILLRVDDDQVTTAALAALGKIRSSKSAELLKQYLAQPAPQWTDAARRNLRRLSFLGVDTGSPRKRQVPLPFHICCAGPPDGDGYRTIVFSWVKGANDFAALCLKLHETSGMVGARGYNSIASSALEGELIELQGEEAVVAVDPGYALCLMRDALYRNRLTATDLPAEFYLHSCRFSGEELEPAPYEPPAPPKKQTAPLTAEFLEELAEDDFFSCWFMTDSSIFGFAAQWCELEQSTNGSERSRGSDLILERLCRELFPPQIERIHRRLLLVADLMGRAGRSPRLVEQTAALAASVAQFRMPYHFHPFLRRFAQESLEMACEALEEGFQISGCTTGAGEECDD
jgi:hypothetical protein